MEQRRRWPPRALNALLFCLALGLAWPAFALDKVTLQLKWTHAFQFAGYYAAQEQGFYRKAGLEVRIVEAAPGTDPVDKVISGQAEYGVGTSSLLLLRNAGKPVVALGVVFQHSPYVLLAGAPGPIRSIHDLAGRRVMLEPRAEELLAYLRKEGIPLERIRRVEHSFDAQDLIAGKVDAISAYVIDQPYYLDLAHFNYQTYTPRSAGIDFYGDNLFTTEQEIKAHPERVKAFRDASLRGWQYAMSHVDEIADLIRAKYSQQHSRDYLLFQARQMLPLIQPELVEIGYMNPGRWQHIAETYSELGMLPADFSVEGFLYQPASPRSLTWLYRALAIALLIIVFSSAVAYRLSRLSAALRTSEERFRLVADNAQDVLWKYDLGRQRLSYVSPSVERLTGYTVEEAMVQSIEESFTKSSAQAVRTALANLASHPEETKSVVELESIRKDGSRVWSEATMSFIRDAQGQPTEVVGVSRDVTARRLLQEQQKRFLAMVSHEFRTPMNAILGMAELLAETELTPEQTKYLEVFQNAGNSLLDLINDILDLSKVEAGQFQLYLEDFALARLLQAQVELLAVRAQDKGLELLLTIAPDVPPFVHGDGQRLKQCITNLVGNALKFCETGGVTIQVERAPNAADMLHFSVADTGIGIPADKLGAIFEAFKQADGSITRNFGGTGLGLTITKRLVELMDGRIWVESVPGQGSTFHFVVRLPAAAAPLAAAAADTAGSAAPRRSLTRPLALLLAEDNPNNVFLMRSMLKNFACHIDAAENGRIAVEKFRSGRYDAILMDMEMPVMDGYSAAREIRRIEQQEGRVPIQIIALTAHALQEDEKKTLNAGCNKHLTKPIRKQVLLDTLNALPPARPAADPADTPRAPQAGDAEQLLAALAGNPHLDVQGALARLEVEPELFLSVLGMFRDALSQYHAGIAAALAGGDVDEARRQAHSLKGEAATVGATALSAAAAALEKALRDGEGARYASLREEVERLIAVVRTALAALPPGSA